MIAMLVVYRASSCWQSVLVDHCRGGGASPLWSINVEATVYTQYITCCYNYIQVDMNKLFDSSHTYKFPVCSYKQVTTVWLPIDPFLPFYPVIMVGLRGGGEVYP